MPAPANISGRHIEIGDEIIARYDRPLPRYTSYPPAPAWKDFSPIDYEHALVAAAGSPISLYIHVPFCAQKCAFCGCNSIATSDVGIMERYVAACLGEISLVSKILGRNSEVRSLHFGGGTPLSVGIAGLEKILNCIRRSMSVSHASEIAIELDPATTSKDDIKSLANLGFNRVSIGVQDFDPAVDRASGRISDASRVGELSAAARSNNISGVNFDLIYGLPLQKPAGWTRTLDIVLGLKPDRIALFNFAHLPAQLPHQRGIDALLLPSPREKIALFAMAVEKFEAAGFAFIGLDHFARKGDTLEVAHKNGALTRTFQGYATSGDMPVVGIGATSISEIGNVYAQNKKKLISYIKKIENGALATSRGLVLTDNDMMRRWIVRSIMCTQKLAAGELKNRWNKNFRNDFAEEILKLKSLVDDGLAQIDDSGIRVTPLGRFFVRNIAAAFDTTHGKSRNVYSRGV